MQTLVFAFDGLDNRCLERYAGVMPAISRLQRTGTTAALDPPVPQASISAWTTVATGCAPHEHGVFDHRTRDGYPGSERALSSADCDRPHVWEYLASQGARTIVCGLPVVDPKRPSAGDGSRSENTTLIPGRSVDSRTTVARASRPWTIADVHSCRDLEALLERRRRVCLDCLEHEPWELAIVHVPILTPGLLTRLAGTGECESETVRRRALHSADRLVEAVLESVPDTTTVIGCSPAGIRYVDGYAVHLNELLAEAGFLERTRPNKRDGIAGTVSRVATTLRESVTSAAYSGAQHRIHSRNGGTTAWSAFDWERSKAFCPSRTGGGIRLNVAGREPNGTITNSRYRETQQAVIDALANCLDPDGEPAFEFVCRRDHLYPGRPPRDVPDVVVSTAGTNCTISTGPNRTIYSRYRGFVRSSPGRCFLAGPAVCGTTERRLTGADIASMVMASLGRPVPARMTGTVPADLFVDPAVRGTYRHVDERSGSLPVRSFSRDEDFRV